MWVHRISNVDSDKSLGDCASCGQGVPVRKRTSGSYECTFANRERGKKYVSEKYGSISKGWRRQKLMKRYGLTEDAYLSLLQKQGGRCAICGRLPEEFTRPFHVDHDHLCCSGVNTCGKCIRGLLCSVCNHMLSAIETEFHNKALRYLECYSDKRTK